MSRLRKTLTLALFWRDYSRSGGRWWFVPCGALSGLAVLAKGPVGLLLPTAVTLLFLAWERRLSLLFACLAPTIALVRAQDMRTFGLSERSRLDPARVWLPRHRPCSSHAQCPLPRPGRGVSRRSRNPLCRARRLRRGQ